MKIIRTAARIVRTGSHVDLLLSVRYPIMYSKSAGFYEDYPYSGRDRTDRKSCESSDIRTLPVKVQTGKKIPDLSLCMKSGTTREGILSGLSKARREARQQTGE